MGVSLAVYALDSSTCQRADAIAQRHDDEAGGALVESLGDPWWGPERGDYKSWDVIHWALTGTESDDGSEFRLFGIPPLDTFVFGEWSSLIDPPTTRKLADELARVGPEPLANRLHAVPESVYWGESFGHPDRHADVLADAGDFVAFARRAADDERGLLFLLG